MSLGAKQLQKDRKKKLSGCNFRLNESLHNNLANKQLNVSEKANGSKLLSDNIKQNMFTA